MPNESSPGSLGQAIAGAAIATYHEQLQKELVRSPLTGLASPTAGTQGIAIGAVAAVAAPAMGTAAALGILPYLASKMIGMGIAGSALNNHTQNKEILQLDETRTEEHIVKIAKKAEFATIRAISKRFKNVKFLNSKPTNEVTETQISGRKTEANPLTIADPETFIHRMRKYCEQHGCSTDEAELVAKFAGAFAQSEMSEEFQVLSAAQNLRGQFHLTPKPSIRWGQRKQEGAEIVLGDVLGDYAHDLPFRQKTLAELNHQEWWEAFYKEDAEAGRITDANVEDRGFRQSHCRSLKIGSLTPLMGPPKLQERRESLATILGSDQPEKAQSFMIPGSAKRASSKTSSRSA